MHSIGRQKLRRAFSISYPILNVRGKTTYFNLGLFFGSGPSVGGLCAETGQLFEILKQTCPEGTV